MAAPRPKILIHYMQDSPQAVSILSLHELDIEGLNVLFWFDTYSPMAKSEDQKNKALKMIRARERVLSEDWDYLFNVKDDVILPKNALKELLRAKKHSIGGLMREKKAAFGIDDYVAFILDLKGPQDSDDRPIEHKKDFEFGDILQATKMAIGCWLVDKATLAKVEFELDDYEKYFYKCGAEGIKMFVHTGVRCGHVDINGTIIKT